ncbi:MAG: alpha/beta hydrolase family esterase [Ilumatobacteraceae bacterium]
MPVGRSDGTLVTPDGRTRTYHLYVPRGLDPAGAPLLVALHGGTGSGGQFETTTGFDALADRHRFVVVYPDGVGTGTAEDTLRTWNAGICCGPAVRKGVDDVGFVRRLIDTLSAKATIDPRRVFAAGHSNGAFMAYRLACELSDRIVAVGLQAGGLGVPRCTPSRPVSLLHIHGTADTNVPIAGGTGSGISGVTFPPLDQSLGIVTAAMGCNSMTGPTVSGRVTTTQWTRGGGAVAVERRLVDGEPHRWIRVADFDSSTAIVDFLLAHPRA